MLSGACVSKSTAGLASRASFVTLGNGNDSHTRDFGRLYGEAQLNATISWFERAHAESGAMPTV